MNSQWLRAGALGSFAAAILLAAQFGIATGLGSDLILLETAFDAARLTAFLQIHAPTVTNLMIADNLFVVAYTTSFVALAFYAKTRQRLFAWVALGFALLTSASDITENALTISLARAALSGVALETNWLLGLQMLAQWKWMWIYVGVTLFAVTLWDATRRARVMAILFLLFPLIGVMAPASVMLGLLRIAWMFVLLLAGGIFLWHVASENAKSL
jgi:hypothetical protein